MAALARLGEGQGALTVLDTHAGAGLYDLHGEAARRSAEADAGVARLIAAAHAPEVFAPLISAVRAENPDGALRWYPGSPLVAAGVLRPGDRFLGCELRDDDAAALTALLRRRGRAGVEARGVVGDGFDALIDGAAGKGRRLVLIDPPFERGDDYPRIVESVAADLRRGGEGAWLIWTPLKDLQTYDAFLGGVEGLGAPALSVECRLRPLDRPLRLNGCALVLIGPSALLDAVAPAAEAAAAWTARAAGGEGAAARLERVG